MSTRFDVFCPKVPKINQPLPSRRGSAETVRRRDNYCTEVEPKRGSLGTTPTVQCSSGHYQSDTFINPCRKHLESMRDTPLSAMVVAPRKPRRKRASRM
jgi:hypothetical protein